MPGLDRQPLPMFDEAAHEVPDSVRSDEHAELREVGTYDEHDVLVQVASPCVEIAVVPRLEDASHDLHVVLRHRLVRQAHGFEGFRVSQKVADANDLSRAKVEDFSDFLGELDAGHPGGHVDLTEGEDRLAEVAELPGSVREARPRLAAVLPPDLSRAVMPSVGGCLSRKARLDRRVP